MRGCCKEEAVKNGLFLDRRNIVRAAGVETHHGPARREIGREPQGEYEAIKLLILEDTI